MSSNQINTLTSGTINGLNSLALDELTTTSLTAGTMDGDLFFIDRIEANEVIVDTQLRLTNTGVFSVGAVTISDIELTYLDGVSSNIQTQINNINTNNSALTTTVATHTTQIAALQASDTTQNTTLATHTSQISAIQTVNATQTTDINSLNYAVSGQATTLTTHTTQISALQTSDTTQNANISNLQASDTTQNTNITNLQTAVTNLQSSDTTQNTNISNLQTSVSALQTSDTTQNTNIQVLQGRTQNITANSTATSMSKPLIINNTGTSLQMNGNTVNIKAKDFYGIDDKWFMGNDVIERLTITNYENDSIYLRSGCKSDIDGTLGWKPLKIYSLGVSLYRGGTETGNTETFIGTYGANQVSPTDNNFYISGNGANNVNILASSGSVNLNGSTVGITATTSNLGGSTLNMTATTIANLTAPAVVITSNTADIDLNVPGDRAITANTNVLYLGSGTANSNGFYSNLRMLDPTGNNWETQSRAFTESLRSSLVVLQPVAIAVKQEIIRIDIPTTGASNGNVVILGRTQTLTPSTNYTNSVYAFNLGLFLYNNGGSAYFNSSGQWIYNAKQRVSVQFDITFNSLSTGIKIFTTRLFTLPQTGSLNLFSSRPMGVSYNQGGGNPLNNILYVSTGQFIVDISNLNRLFLETQNFFSTSGDGASVTTSGRLTFYLLPY
jgi:hypothetical protein